MVAVRSQIQIRVQIYGDEVEIDLVGGYWTTQQDSSRLNNWVNPNGQR